MFVFVLKFRTSFSDANSTEFDPDTKNPVVSTDFFFSCIHFVNVDLLLKRELTIS